MSIPADLVDAMMVKCGRRCCVCRRFKPIHLQVHHIVEQSAGGKDEEDNLIVICLPCHTDVHSTVPFARRFSHNELKGHRDALIQLVANGQLPLNEQEDESAFQARLVAIESEDDELSPAAVKLLTLAAFATSNRLGMIVVSNSNMGTGIYPGDAERLYEHHDRRSEAMYKSALEELEQRGYLDHTSESLREITHHGYLKADELAAKGVAGELAR